MTSLRRRDPDSDPGLNQEHAAGWNWLARELQCHWARDDTRAPLVQRAMDRWDDWSSCLAFEAAVLTEHH